ncbi:MAG: hypothetical protein ACHQUC_05955 [Chlamydiales bacterium]
MWKNSFFLKIAQKYYDLEDYDKALATAKKIECDDGLKNSLIMKIADKFLEINAPDKLFSKIILKKELVRAIQISCQVKIVEYYLEKNEVKKALDVIINTYNKGLLDVLDKIARYCHDIGDELRDLEVSALSHRFTVPIYTDAKITFGSIYNYNIFSDAITKLVEKRLNEYANMSIEIIIEKLESEASKLVVEFNKMSMEEILKKLEAEVEARGSSG